MTIHILGTILHKHEVWEALDTSCVQAFTMRMTVIQDLFGLVGRLLLREF